MVKEKELVEIRCWDSPKGILWEARHLYIDLPALHGYFETIEDIIKACLDSNFHIVDINKVPQKLTHSDRSDF